METKEIMNSHRDQSDNELVALSGLNSPHSELLRRNTDALKKSSEANELHSARILFLSIIMLAVAAATYILSIVPEGGSEWVKYGLGMIMVPLMVWFLIRELSKNDK